MKTPLFKRLALYSFFYLLISCSVSTEKVDYSNLISHLNRAIEYEMEDKNLPSFAIVIVDENKIIWSKNFGFEAPDDKKAADENTIYRIGSVSKLFTDIAIMQLVERGEIDLDAPVTSYLPDFNPVNKFGTPITLRQLMSHKSGLIREPKVGHYFDDTSPSLELTVASLNGSELVYEPETATKYSNAGIAVVGRVLEKVKGIPFNIQLRDNVLLPMGLDNSSFEPTQFVQDHLAYGEMWSYDGRKFPAPKFELGMAPAGSMYATIGDLGKFLQVILKRGEGENGKVIEPETLISMWEPQFSMMNYGIGFNLSEKSNVKRVGHGGAIYGFSTQLTAVPDESIGIATVSTADVTNSITTRIADYGLSLLMALKRGETLEEYQISKSLGIEEGKTFIGRYKNGDSHASIVWVNNQLVLKLGSIENRLKKSDTENTLVLDGRLNSGQQLVFSEMGFSLGQKTFEKFEKEVPGEHENLSEYMGEFGWDHNVLFIYEKQNTLYCLVEWVFKYELKETEPDLFSFPANGGLYHGEKLRFNRNESGKIESVEIVNSVLFPKRITADATETFRIQPLRPVDELREIALKGSPPQEEGKEDPKLIEPSTIDKTIKLDIRYASTNNFMSNKFYEQPRAFMQKPAALAVVEANKLLKEYRVGLLIHDAYRPWYVTKMFWDATPDDKKIFVANPQQGSRHNRGCAVDITLYDLSTGEPIEMVAGYDEMSERSYPNYMGGTSKQRWYRRLLRETMESVGFTVYGFEWWHFDYKTWNDYPILNIRFEDL